MDKKSWSTDLLWSLLMGIISLCLVLILSVLIYLPLEESITAYLNPPKYDQKILDRAFAERQIPEEEDDYDKVSNGIHVRTGMVHDDNFILIQQHCLSCHSSKLITQNRADRAGWKQMIVWMQETQGLGDLGTAEPKILDYLSSNYAPQKIGRRPNLDQKKIAYYILEL